jgi:hypothetical protein
LGRPIRDAEPAARTMASTRTLRPRASAISLTVELGYRTGVSGAEPPRGVPALMRLSWTVRVARR